MDTRDIHIYPQEFRDEIYSRIVTFFGDENFIKVSNAFVIIVGLGGVGSHAANMLVRSGVQKIRIIDFDQVSLSSLNRHAFANMSDVGKSKTGSVHIYLPCFALHIFMIFIYINLHFIVSM